MWALRLMGSLVQQGKWGLQPLLSSCLWCCDWRIHLILLSLTVIRQFLGASGLHGYLINSHGVWDGPYLSLTVGAHLSCVWLFVTPWTVTCQVPLSMGFPRQEHWSGLPCPPLGYLLDPGMEPMSPASRALEADSLPLCRLGSPPVDSCWKLSLSLSCFCIDIFFFWEKALKNHFHYCCWRLLFSVAGVANGLGGYSPWLSLSRGTICLLPRVKKEFIGPGLHLRAVRAGRAWPPLQWTLNSVLSACGNDSGRIRPPLGRGILKITSRLLIA